MRNDVVSGLILLGIAAAYYIASTGIQDSALADEVGPRGLPDILSVLLATIALVICGRGLMTAPASEATLKPDRDAAALWYRALGFLAIAALYIPLAQVLGYSDALFLLLIAVPWYEGMKPSWRNLAVAAGGAVFFGILFVGLLDIRQPEGIVPWWLDIYQVLGSPIVAGLKSGLAFLSSGARP